MTKTPQNGPQYFSTFTDDKTHFVWVYILNSKDQVFERFLKWWKNQVEESSNVYAHITEEKEFLTVPKTPEQNGVAERMGRMYEQNIARSC